MQFAVTSENTVVRFCTFLSKFSNFRQVSFANVVVLKCVVASLYINDQIKTNVNQVKQQQKKTS